ncbi:MAG: glycerol-3-phosphate 1-O-acyltransferase PlsY [Candidatus Cybelea sp.]|jgi:glycerol-3-phosphate acyltransferase PlsY
MDVGIPESTAIGMFAIVLAMVIGVFIAAYLIGSIPFGYLVGRLFFHTDIRKQGSGNIGAMNALRALGTGGAAAVLLLDVLKGFVPTLWALNTFNGLFESMDSPGFPPGGQIVASLVATAAVLGHCFSPWLRFRGGKGVATFFGAVLALCWPAGLVAVGGWVAGAAITRYSSVGSMLGSVLAPIALWIFTGSLPETAFGVFAALIVLLRHRDNIARLRAGAESPIRLSKPSS